jgi:hypothetical protein
MSRSAIPAELDQLRRSGMPAPAGMGIILSAATSCFPSSPKAGHRHPAIADEAGRLVVPVAKTWLKAFGSEGAP